MGELPGIGEASSWLDSPHGMEVDTRCRPRASAVGPLAVSVACIYSSGVVVVVVVVVS
jgi:hypothetical protein